MRKEFHTLISLDKALEIVMRNAPEPRTKEVCLDEAVGRVIAETIIATVDVPNFDRASMDGYAVRSEDCLLADEISPVRLKIKGSLSPGMIPDISLEAGEAIEISTGSVMPEGADAVVMVEHADALDNCVMIRRPVHPWENVQRRGADISLGERAINSGAILGAREIGLLAALGRKRVNVRYLRVGVASTGDELVEPDDELTTGKIYDVNSYTISSALRQIGAEPVVYGVVPDSYDALAEVIASSLMECDMLLLSGSTSAGVGDMLYRVIEDLGRIEFHGINLKPGKPTLFGIVGERPLIGLPGYPTSALTVFWQLAAPMIMRSLGLRAIHNSVRATLARPFRSESRRQMLPVMLRRGKAYPFDRGSGAITTLALSDGIIDIQADREYIHSGEEVDVYPLDFPFAQEGSYLIVTGENCAILENALEQMHIDFRYMVKSAIHAIADLQDGLADIACLSSYESEVNGDLVVMKSYRRELGLIAREAEILSNYKDATFAGWSRDAKMSSIMNSLLPGVRTSLNVKTHVGAALAVATGEADIALASRAVAESYGLYFHPLAEDEISIIARRENMEEMSGILACLRG